MPRLAQGPGPCPGAYPRRRTPQPPPPPFRAKDMGPAGFVRVPILLSSLIRCFSFCEGACLFAVAQKGKLFEGVSFLQFPKEPNSNGNYPLRKLSIRSDGFLPNAVQ